MQKEEVNLALYVMFEECLDEILYRLDQDTLKHAIIFHYRPDHIDIEVSSIFIYNPLLYCFGLTSDEFAEFFLRYAREKLGVKGIAALRIR